MPSAWSRPPGAQGPRSRASARVPFRRTRRRRGSRWPATPGRPRRCGRARRAPPSAVGAENSTSPSNGRSTSPPPVTKPVPMGSRAPSWRTSTATFPSKARALPVTVTGEVIGRTAGGGVEGDAPGGRPQDPPGVVRAQLAHDHGRGRPVGPRAHLDLARAGVALHGLADDRVGEADEVDGERTGGGDGVVEALRRAASGNDGGRGVAGRRGRVVVGAAVESVVAGSVVTGASVVVGSVTASSSPSRCQTSTATRAAITATASTRATISVVGRWGRWPAGPGNAGVRTVRNGGPAGEAGPGRWRGLAHRTPGPGPRGGAGGARPRPDRRHRAHGATGPIDPWSPSFAPRRRTDDPDVRLLSVLRRVAVSGGGAKWRACAPTRGGSDGMMRRERFDLLTCSRSGSRALPAVRRRRSGSGWMRVEQFTEDARSSSGRAARHRPRQGPRADRRRRDAAHRRREEKDRDPEKEVLPGEFRYGSFVRVSPAPRGHERPGHRRQLQGRHPRGPGPAAPRAQGISDEGSGDPWLTPGPAGGRPRRAGRHPGHARRRGRWRGNASNRSRASTTSSSGGPASRSPG